MADLAGDPAAEEEEPERGSDIRDVEAVAVKPWQDQGDEQEDGVAGLVRGETVVFRERYGVLDAGATTGVESLAHCPR